MFDYLIVRYFGVYVNSQPTGGNGKGRIEKEIIPGEDPYQACGELDSLNLSVVRSDHEKRACTASLLPRQFKTRKYNTN